MTAGELIEFTASHFTGMREPLHVNNQGCVRAVYKLCLTAESEILASMRELHKEFLNCSTFGALFCAAV